MLLEPKVKPLKDHNKMFDTFVVPKLYKNILHEMHSGL